MARFRALIAMVILGWGATVLAQETDSPPPRTRGKSAIRQIQGTAGDEAAEAAPSADPRLPRRPPQTMRLEQISPELQQILEEWEIESAKIQRLAGKIHRYSYSKTFLTEQRALGKFLYEAPDKGVYELIPAKVTPGEDGSKKYGKQFKLAHDTGELWYCTGESLIKIDRTAKSYELIPIPESSRGKGIIETPLPFLFGMKADQARRRYLMTLLPETNAKQVWLKVVPRWQADAANYREAKLILDRTTYLPQAVQLLDATGELERVHLFRELSVNKKGWFEGDPFRPDLRGLSRVLNAETATNREGGGKPLPGRTARSLQK